MSKLTSRYIKWSNGILINNKELNYHNNIIIQRSFQICRVSEEV